MTKSFILQGEPARVPATEIIELLAKQDAASEAAANGEPPVFEQVIVGLQTETAWSGRPSFDVRFLKAEREWSSLIAQALTKRTLVVCDRFGRELPRLGIERGSLSVTAVAQWLANAGIDVELDGVRVEKTEPKVVAQPVERIRKAAMVKKLERHWPTIENDLKEAARPGHWLRTAQMDWGHYDMRLAIELAKQAGKFKEITLPWDPPSWA